MRFTIVAALALTAIPAAANAQAEPVLKGPYYVTGSSPNGASLVAMGTLVRDGDRARITRIIMLAESTDAAGLPIWRIDATAEFDCARKLTRPLVIAARDDKGKLLQVAGNDGDFEDLPPGDPTAAVAMTAACSGNPPSPALAPKIDDFEGWQTRYRAGHAGDQ